QPGAMSPRLGLLLALLGCPAALDPALEEAWEGWKSLHAKEYPGEVEAARREVWEKNLRRIQQHNWEESRGQHRFRLEMNHYGDLVPAPGPPNLGLIGDLGPLDAPRAGSGQWGPLDAPRAGSGDLGPLNAPRAGSGDLGPLHVSRGHCGSCWAFSATGALEGLVFKRTGKPAVLSEQNLIDCSRKLGNNGCRGGYMTRAFQYVRDNGGLNSEHVPAPASLCPSSQDTSSCRYNPQDRAANCSAIWLVAQGNETALEQAVATVGPVSVAVDASGFHFHFYKSGVFSSAFCSQRVNHGMLAVGYGTSQDNGHNVSYWILKNSWSELWGERGYLRLLKGAHNPCGVANQASFPSL
ncbi:CATL2 protein, partial [Alopecoenas beccarii]|nr:CATL2 protein [Alopecoenas beccarii]